MSDSGIHKFEVTYTDGAKDVSPKPIAAVSIDFGDGHRLEIDATTGPAIVRLIGRHASIQLDSGEPPSSFDRAINILRLRMPMRP